MRIKEIFKHKPQVLSMEVFPPKRNGALDQLFHVVSDLKALSPDYISVTYGAGGSTRNLTKEIALNIKKNAGIESMAHLTCVGNTKNELKEILEDLKNSGIDNILALRGDPPQGQNKFEAVEGGFQYANELIEFIRNEEDYFSIGVAGYPEKHPEAKNYEEDILNLKRKVDAGADFIVTQLFFNNDDFYRFMDKVRSIGIDIPVIPGIFLISSYKQIHRLAELCGATIPKDLENKLYQFKDNNEEIKKIGIDFALQQSENILNRQIAQGLHYYIMNRKDMIEKIVQTIKMK